MQPDGCRIVKSNISLSCVRVSSRRNQRCRQNQSSEKPTVFVAGVSDFSRRLSYCECVQFSDLRGCAPFERRYLEADLDTCTLIGQFAQLQKSHKTMQCHLNVDESIFLLVVAFARSTVPLHEHYCKSVFSICAYSHNNLKRRPILEEKYHPVLVYFRPGSDVGRSS